MPTTPSSLKVARSEPNSVGSKVARFTVAAFINSGVWNNDGAGTAYIAENTADAAFDGDSRRARPTTRRTWSSWLEDIHDADIDFWGGRSFAAGGLLDNAKPSTPALVTPTNTAGVTASPNLSFGKVA